MGKAAVLGSSVAMGAAIYFSGTASMEYIQADTAEFNQRVEACAGQLGRTAMTAASLPQGCTDWSAAFERTTSSVAVYDPKTRMQTVKEEEVQYVLPSADDFRKQHIITPEQDTQERDARQKFALTVSLLGAVSWAGLKTNMDRQNRRARAAASGN